MDNHASRMKPHGSIAEHGIRYWLVAPALFLLLLIGLFPLLYSLVVSFQNVNLMEIDTSFQGLLNYERLIGDKRLWESLGHTLLLMMIALPIELMLGLLLALLCLERLPGKQLFVALLIMPTVISPVVAGAAWRLLFDHRYGPVNHIVSFFAGEPVTILWTVTPAFVYPAILITEVWQWTPFMFLLLLAALGNVDRSQLEAAQIDGAGYWRIVWRIMLPAIRPVMMIAILIRALDLFRVFDMIWALTQGGPGTSTETISIYAYVQGFKQFETSYTAAIAFLVIVLLTVLVIGALKRMNIDRAEPA